MDLKTNFAPENPTPPKPNLSTAPPSNGSAASPTNPAKIESSPLGTNPGLPSNPIRFDSGNLANNNQDLSAILESTPLKKIETEPAKEEKKSNFGLFAIITLILTLTAAIVSGILVYSWQVSQLDPIQKEKALLQSQVGNLSSQIDILQKELEKQKAINSLVPLTPPPPTNVPSPIDNSAGEIPVPTEQQNPLVNQNQNSTENLPPVIPPSVDSTAPSVPSAPGVPAP